MRWGARLVFDFAETQQVQSILSKIGISEILDRLVRRRRPTGDETPFQVSTRLGRASGYTRPT